MADTARELIDRTIPVKEQDGLLALVALNRLTKRKEIRKSVQVWRVRATFNWRSRKSLMGRFGGGWQWALGFTLGGSTLILNLVVCSLRFDLKESPDAP